MKNTLQSEVNKLDARIARIEINGNIEEMRKFESLYKLRMKLLTQMEESKKIHFAY